VGELGRRLVRLDLQPLLAALARAYADEWFAHYNFRFVAHALRGHRSPSVADFVARRSDEAVTRADRLAARIAELGGRLPPTLATLPEHATDKPFKLPPSMADVDGVLRAVLDAERTSLRTYEDLHARTRDGDPLTHALALDLLAAAVRNEEIIERLLGDAAPAMDGR
jgi:ferritin-like protein